MAKPISLFRLPEEPERVSYSPRERQIFSLLSKHGETNPISSTNLVEAIYDGDPPFNGRVIVMGAMRQLAKKLFLNGEPVRIGRSPQKGPKPLDIWIEKAEPA